MFSLKSALAGAALSLALIGGVTAAQAAQTTPEPMRNMHEMSGGMMQMMDDPVGMCDKMMHAIATDPAMHKHMNDLMRQAMSSSKP